jgi:hypothetical protein
LLEIVSADQMAFVTELAAGEDVPRLGKAELYLSLSSALPHVYR